MPTSTKHPVENLWRNAPYQAAKLATLFLCLGASISYVKYSSVFPSLVQSRDADPADVDLSWFLALPTEELTEVAFCGACTWSVNALFQYRALMKAYGTGFKELELFLNNKTIHPFLIEVGMAVISAIPGGAIAGNTFSGALKWGAKAFGFLIYFTYSFLGTYDLIHSYGNEQEQFQSLLLDKLQHLNETVYPVQAYWQDRVLTTESLEIFLIELFSRAEQDSKVFRSSKRSERALILTGKVLDNTISAALTAMFSLIFVASGFDGINALTGNRLDKWSNPTKIALGFPFAFPLLLFSFFISKPLDGQCGKSWSSADKSLANALHFSLLLLVCAGCSTWGYSLAKRLAQSESIFSPTLDDDFGQQAFPVFVYCACLISGLNGLSPMVLRTSIKTDSPQAEDLIRYIRKNNDSQLTSQLKRHGYFSKPARDPLVTMNEDFEAQENYVINRFSTNLPQ